METLYRANLPTPLKVVAVYLLLYGLFTGYFVVENWSDWESRIADRSLGYTLGYLLKGPLLAPLALAASFGLSGARMWGRNCAICVLVLSTIFDAQAFAWGYSQSPPTVVVLLAAFALYAGWNAIWAVLLFRRSVREALN